MTRTTRPFALTLAAFALVLAVLGGCAGGSAGGDAADTAPATETTETTPTEEATSGPALVARTGAEVDVFADPAEADAGAEPTATLPATTGFGSPRALLVLDQREGWLEVALPTRPNGSTGWIRSDGIDVREVSYELVVDIEARTLTLLDGGDEVLTTPAAIGTAEFPTPTGEFYLVDKLATGENGAYGPFALGLSAHSEVLTEFAGGDGQVGIHGTNDPGTIGEAVSHGCVRVPNDVITRLADLLPLGTPVTVV
jgi:lipoprotein-anchoring transpeptidase ErfK/SrfK